MVLDMPGQYLQCNGRVKNIFLVLITVEKPSLRLSIRTVGTFFDPVTRAFSSTFELQTCFVYFSIS